MHPIIYDVAVSVDGFISGPDGDVSQFAHEGPVVDAYQKRLAGYTCAIMGRATYEFGYQFGLQPGQNPYPHMQTYVVSKSIQLPKDCSVTQITDGVETVAKDLRAKSTGPVYLCGGGMLAATLWQSGLIDLVRLKRAPVLFGGGIPLFSGSVRTRSLNCTRTQNYDNGYVYQEFIVG